MGPRLISILYILVFFSCKTKTNSWQTLDFGQFKLNAPADWTIIKENGSESYVGGLTNKQDTLWFDYGVYDLNFGDDSLAYLMLVDTINGLKANIFLSDTPRNDLVMMQVSIPNRSKKFTIGGRNINNYNLVLEMFKSLIIIDVSSKQHNVSLTMEKFKKVHYLSARNLILSKCGVCHLSENGYKNLPLKEFIQSRSSDWLFNFFTGRNQLQADTLYVKRRQANQIHCPEFPKFTKADIERIKELYP
jgi:hypothetical protein